MATWTRLRLIKHVSMALSLVGINFSGNKNKHQIRSYQKSSKCIETNHVESYHLQGEDGLVAARELVV